MEVLDPNDPRLQWVSGGEVGATGMGDDLHYTGQESLYTCIIAEMTGRSGGGGMGPIRALIHCLD